MTMNQMQANAFMDSLSFLMLAKCRLAFFNSASYGVTWTIPRRVSADTCREASHQLFAEQAHASPLCVIRDGGCS